MWVSQSTNDRRQRASKCRAITFPLITQGKGLVWRTPCPGLLFNCQVRRERHGLHAVRGAGRSGSLVHCAEAVHKRCLGHGYASCGHSSEYIVTKRMMPAYLNLQNCDLGATMPSRPFISNEGLPSAADVRAAARASLAAHSHPMHPSMSDDSRCLLQARALAMDDSCAARRGPNLCKLDWQPTGIFPISSARADIIMVFVAGLGSCAD